MLQNIFFFFQKGQQNLLLKNKDLAQFVKQVECGREKRTHEQLWLEESRFWCPLGAPGCPAAVKTRKGRVKVQDCPSRLSEPPQGAQLRQKLHPCQVLWRELWLSCGLGCTGVFARRREGVGVTVLVKGVLEGKTNRMRGASSSDCCS